MKKIDHEADVAHVGAPECSFRADDAAASKAFRTDYAGRTNLISPEQMPFEHSADGLIKHLVHHKLNSRECCVEAYMQFIAPGGRTGKHRHMWEEVLFVLEGAGYDLHWDARFECEEEYAWSWEAEPKRFEWKRGDFIFIPPFAIHQHVNASAESEARLIVISNRIVKEMGFDWFDQLENAPGS